MHRSVRAVFRWTLLGLVAVSGCDCGDDGGLQTVRPTITATPSPLVFAHAYVSFTARETLTLKNVGNAALSITSVRIKEGSHPGLAVDDAQVSLVPGTSQAVEVRLVANAVGPIQGAILVASNDPATPILEVPVTATGERRPGPALSVCIESSDAGLASTCVDPLRIDFGAVAFGETRRGTINLQSSGTAPVEIFSAEAQPSSHPSITFAPPQFSGMLAVDATQVFEVAFSPTVGEEVTAVFQIQSSDEQRSLVPVIVTGSGIAPAICPSLSNIDFGVVAIGSSARRTLTLESCGQVDLELRGLSIESGSPEFSVVTPLPSTMTLAPGATFDVELEYRPNNPGRDQDRLKILSSLADGFIGLTGEAAACDLVATPTSLDFGGVSINGARTRALLLENAGALDCSVTGLTLGAGTSSEFSLVSPPALPATIAPGSSITVDVEYRPTDSGSDMGTLVVASNDPGQAGIVIALSGRRLGLGECALTITPDPIGFGAVPLGTTQPRSVQLQNVGSNTCTILQIKLSPTTPRVFQLGPINYPMIILAGGSETIDVIFRPTTSSQETGELQIFAGLVPLTPDYLVPISGSGSGPQLCVNPDPVVFGTHALGQPLTQQVQLSACGTESLVVSSLTLPAPTSSEYQISMQPSLPATLAAGGSTSLSITYLGVDLGRDDGILRVASNDAQAATRDVPLIAHSSSGPCGDVQARICNLSGSGPVAGATVYVDTPSGRVQTTTDQNGDFVLTCLPVGGATVHAEMGSWSTTFAVTVNAYQTTVVPGQQCLDPNAEIAVVWGEWDNIQNILHQLNVSYTLYGDGFPSASDLLEDPNELAQYDIVFLNCGFDEFLATGNPGLTNLRNFVANGGSVYASDWAYDAIEVGWPSFIDFDGDDMTRNAAQSAGNFNGAATIVDAGLSTILGGLTSVNIYSCCTAMESASGSSTVYLEADRFNDGGTHPLMVGFRPAPMSGQVFYTDFHNSEQALINDVFEWLLLQL